jgi:hypothetical protein
MHAVIIVTSANGERKTLDSPSAVQAVRHVESEMLRSVDTLRKLHEVTVCAGPRVVARWRAANHWQPTLYRVLTRRAER